MTLKNSKAQYSRFLAGHTEKLHFAAHSHHFWPDVSREAHLAYWDDCALASDEKWNKIFAETIPHFQQHVASMLKLKDHKQIVFAPNTHELGARILSQFLGQKKLSILTSASEFHSWRRQLLRLEELEGVSVQSLSVDKLLTNRREVLENFRAALKSGPDLFFISQVFFDSALALTDSELIELQSSCLPSTTMVVDGYHGFAALPTDLSLLEGKIFYMGGGYKYAQAGEGAAFLVVPKGQWRPAHTGWFAEYGELSHPAGAQVGYTSDGMAFMGATQDMSGLYRFNAVWDHFKNLGWDIPSIHQYVLGLQKEFIRSLPESFKTNYQLGPLFTPELNWHGHFLTFEAQTLDLAEACENKLKTAQITIDRRGKRLRFGFGLYQDFKDVALLVECLKKLA